MYTPNTRSHERALSMRCVIRMCSRSFKEAVTCKVRRFEARETGEEAATGMIGIVRLQNRGKVQTGRRKENRGRERVTQTVASLPLPEAHEAWQSLVNRGLIPPYTSLLD